jgi:hypothetical protein
VLAWSPGPGGRQQRAELVAVQCNGMGLVVHPWSGDMRSRRAGQEFFLDGVLIEPGDGGQPPGDRGAGPARGFQVPGEGLDVGAADGEQRQGTSPAPAGELTQVQRVRLSCRSRYPARNPARASRSASVKTGWIVASAADGAAVVMGYLPARLEPGRWADSGPSDSTELRRMPSGQVMLCRQPTSAMARQAAREYSIPNRLARSLASGTSRAGQIVQFGI